MQRRACAPNVFADSYAWLDGNQLRQGVAYMVAPGSALAFGDLDTSYTLKFEEAGSVSPAMEMLMKACVDACTCCMYALHTCNQLSRSACAGQQPAGVLCRQLPSRSQGMAGQASDDVKKKMEDI